MILRKATYSDAAEIWNILQDAIAQRKEDGSDQWQNGYPNEKVIQDDLVNGHAYVITEKQLIVGYAAIVFDIEPAYNNIKGKWLSNGDYVVLHRLAIAKAKKRKGVASQLFKLLEELCLKQKVYSIKVDTNFDNVPMLKILHNLGYTYCGEVILAGAARRAYEKIIHRS